MFKNGKLYPGSPIQLTVNFTDGDGEQFDPDTVSIRTVNPIGQETTYTYNEDDEIQRVSEGNYTADITPDMTGRWHFRWETTGTGQVIAVEDSFIVQASSFSPYSYFGRRDYA